MHAPWLVRPSTSLYVSPGQAMAWPAEHQKPRKHGVHSDASPRPVRSPTVPGPHAVGEAAPISQKLFSGQIVHLVWWYSPVYEPLG